MKMINKTIAVFIVLNMVFGMVTYAGANAVTSAFAAADDDVLTGDGIYRIDANPFDIAKNTLEKSTENNRLYDYNAKLSWGSATKDFCFFNTANFNEKIKTTGYNYINAWIYNPEIKQVDSKTCGLNWVLITGSSADDVSAFSYYRSTVTMNWTGWKLISLKLPGGFQKQKADANLDYGIYKISLNANGWTGNTQSWPSENNFAYVDAMWLSKQAPKTELSVTAADYADDGGYVPADLGGDNTFVFETSSQVSQVRASGAVTMKKDGEILKSGYTLNAESDKLNIIFNNKLQNLSKYEITLGENLCDIYGNFISESKTVVLNTEPEYVISEEDNQMTLNTPLINFNEESEVTKTGGSADKNHVKKGNLYSVGWTNTSKVNTLFLKSPVSDWTDYERLEFWIYSEEATGDTIIVLAESPANADNSLNYYLGRFTVDWSGWKKVSISFFNMVGSRKPDWKNIMQVRFCSTGWSINPNGCTSRLYIADARITGGDGTSLSGIYSEDKIREAKAAMAGTAAVYAGSPNVVTEGGEVKALGNGADVYTYKTGDTVMVPLLFFEKFFGAQVTKTETAYSISIDSHNLSGKINEKDYSADSKKCSFEQPAQIIDGMVYIDAASAAEALGLTVVSDRLLVVAGKNDGIKALARYTGVNELNEIIAYLASHINMSESVPDEDLNTIKDRWRYELAGSAEDNDTSNPEIAKKIKSVNDMGKNAQNKMIKREGQTELFSGITTTATAQMTSTYSMLYEMALAYATCGCELYHNEALKDDILYGLRWMYENRYGRAEMSGTGWRNTADFNWWDWKIGSPKRLISTLMLMEDQLTQTEITDYLALFDYLVPAPTGVGSNAMNTARLAIGSALLQKDSRKIIRMQNATEKTLLYVDNGRNALNMLYGDRGPKKTKGEGFYTDGSYIFHTLHPMNGTYGAEHFTLVGPFVSLFVGTSLEMTTPSTDYISEWIYNAFDPLIYRGAMFRMVKGRYPSGQHSTAASILGGMIDSLDCLSADDRAKVKSIIKAQVTDDTSINYYNTLSLPQTIKLADIMNDESVIARDSLITNHVYYNEDKVVHQRGNFALGISMSSSRIFNYESINNLNLDGWYISDGMTEYYTDDNFTQSQNAYWQYVNPYRLPGTTVDTQLRESVSIHQGNEYLSSKDFVGGVSLEGTYGTAAMWLESYHNDTDFGIDSGSNYGGKAPAHNSNLQAKKAWFMFDDEVVCLGSDINASNGYDVLTVVDNKLASKQSNLMAEDKFIADGIETALSGTDTDLMGTKWAHMENVGGYYFPSGGSLFAKYTESAHSFMELWFDHGTNPNGAAYAYTLLPGKTAEQTKAYAENPDIEVLKNTPKLQVVREKKLNITGIVFWEAGTYNGITANKPMIVMLKEENGKTTVSVCDPTQLLTEAELVIDQKLAALKCDPKMSVTSDDKTHIKIDFKDSDGRSMEVSLTDDGFV